MKRIVSIVTLCSLFCVLSSLDAYIEAPFALGRLVQDSTNIVVLQVDRVDKEQHRILFKKVRDLKGQHPGDIVRHNIGRAGHNPREWQYIMAWAEPGKLAVFMYNGGASETCIDTYWYQAYGGGADWSMSHGEPFLLRSFAGKAEKLAMSIPEILANREVIVPAMADGDKNALHLRQAKVQRLRASLKLLEYNPARDFIGWGSEDFRRLPGMPGFSHQATLARVDPDARGLAPADFDGDGDTDLCLFGETRVVLIQSDGPALNEVALPYAGGARSASWADANGDGKPDLLLGAPGGPKVLINFGTSFRDDSAALPREPYHNVTAAAWIEWDGDGRPDILVANGFLGLRLYRNVSAPAGAAPKGPRFGPWHYIGPFDNAGQRGFDTAYAPEKEINLTAKYRGRGDEQVGWQAGKWTDGQVNNLAVFKPAHNVNSVVYLHREIEADAPVEVPVSLGSDDTLTVWLNGRRLLAENVYRGAAPDQSQAKLALQAGKNRLLLKICQGEGEFAFYFAARPPQPASSTTAYEDASLKAGLGPDGAAGAARGDHLALADVDGDGRTDVLYSAGTGILLRNGPQGFAEARDTGLRYRSGGIAPAFGDFDGDGDLDLFVPQAGQGKLFRNEGGGRFKDCTAEAGDLARPLGEGTSAVWADLFKKGRPDLLVGCLSGPNRYFRNLGGGRFQEAGREIGLDRRVANSRSVAVADVNKDGIWDVVFNNEGQDSFLLLGDPSR